MKLILKGKISKLDGEWGTNRVTVNIRGEEYHGMTWTLSHLDNETAKFDFGDDVLVTIEEA